MGGTPLCSQTPLYGSWRIPEVGLRAHPLSLSVLVAVWRVGTAQLRGGSLFVQSCSKYCPCETADGQCVPKDSHLEVALRDLGGSRETRPVVDSCFSLSAEFSKGNGQSCAHNAAILSQTPFLFAQPCSTDRSLQTHCNSSPALGCLCLLWSCSCLFSSYCNYGTFRWEISRFCAASLMLCFW